MKKLALVLLYCFVFAGISSASVKAINSDPPNTPDNYFCGTGVGETYSVYDSYIYRYKYPSNTPGNPYISQKVYFCMASQYNSSGASCAGSPYCNIQNIKLNSGFKPASTDYLTPLASGYLTFYSHNLDSNYYLEIWVNGARKHNVTLGSFSFRTVTDIIINRGDSVTLTLRNNINGAPTYGPGWKYIDINNSDTWYSDGTENRVTEIINDYNSNRWTANGNIEQVFAMGWGDTDASSSYYDFNDLVLLFAMAPLATPTVTPTVTLTPTPTDPPAPPCNNSYVNMSALPGTQYRLKNIQFLAQKTDTDPYHNLSFTDPLTLPGSVSNCSPHTSTTANCLVSGAPGNYTWVAHYQVSSPGGTHVNTCNVTGSFIIQDPPGYLSTKGGDVYIRNNVFMPSYGDYAQPKCHLNQIRCLSEYLYNYKQANYNYGYYSKDGMVLTNYTDQNNQLLDFATLRQKIKARASSAGVTVSELNSYNYYADVTSTTRRVLDISGSVTLNSGNECKIPTIFLIDGNLTINPNYLIHNYTIDDGKNYGCLFIVSGTLTINGGSTVGQDNYDLIHGFFILTDSSDPLNIPQDGYELIRILGGVVQGNITNSNVNRKAYGTIAGSMPPSEEIVYEGGRYIALFGDLLTDIAPYFNITELSYTNTL